MQIINAFWEKRNLGLNVAEITIEGFDENISEIISTIDKNDYIVVKVPNSKISLIHELENYGFRFLETQFEVCHPIPKRLSIDPYIRRIIDRVKYQQIRDKEGLEKVLNKIDDIMFDTDRFYLDPAFDNSVSSLRYKNWIRYEFYNKSVFLASLIVEGDEIGFFLMTKIDDNKYSSTLAGIFSQFKNSGLGIAAIGKPIFWAYDNKIDKILSRISSNNILSLKVHLELGYKINNVLYVFRKLKFN